jgi:hypothetical protein
MAKSLSKLLKKNRIAPGRMRRPLRQLFGNMRHFLRRSPLRHMDE